MPKQTIEIDVPEGRKIRVSQTDYVDFIQVNIYLEKKEPELIEVRDYLFMSKLGHGVMAGVAQRNMESLEEIETDMDFIKWIDKDWRKVEI